MTVAILNHLQKSHFSTLFWLYNIDTILITTKKLLPKATFFLNSEFVFSNINVSAIKIVEKLEGRVKRILFPRLKDHI